MHVSIICLLKVTWFRNDEQITDGSRFAFMHEGNFYCVDIAPVTKEDQGHWTCMAENCNGRSSCTSFLNVIGTYRHILLCSL